MKKAVGILIGETALRHSKVSTYVEKSGGLKWNTIRGALSAILKLQFQVGVPAIQILAAVTLVPTWH